MVFLQPLKRRVFNKFDCDIDFLLVALDVAQMNIQTNLVIFFRILIAVSWTICVLKLACSRLHEVNIFLFVIQLHFQGRDVECHRSISGRSQGLGACLDLVNVISAIFVEFTNYHRSYAGGFALLAQRPILASSPQLFGPRCLS